jgi:protein TonB
LVIALCGLTAKVPAAPIPVLNSSAGGQQFSVAVQFTQPAPAPEQNPKAEPAVAKRQPAPEAKPALKRSPAATTKPEPVVNAEPEPAVQQQPKATPEVVEHKTPTAQPETVAEAAPPPQGATTNSGVNERPVVTEPLFAAPPRAPRYPTLARKRGQEGVVWLEIWLDEEGEQQKLQVTASSGLSVLDRSALKAVASWQFKPYELNGVRMASRVKLPIEFNLN